jgi:hypothetical protein
MLTKLIFAVKYGPTEGRRCGRGVRVRGPGATEPPRYTTCPTGS